MTQAYGIEVARGERYPDGYASRGLPKAPIHTPKHRKQIPKETSKATIAVILDLFAGPSGVLHRIPIKIGKNATPWSL